MKNDDTIEMVKENTLTCEILRTLEVTEYSTPGFDGSVDPTCMSCACELYHIQMQDIFGSSRWDMP